MCVYMNINTYIYSYTHTHSRIQNMSKRASERVDVYNKN